MLRKLVFLSVFSLMLNSLLIGQSRCDSTDCVKIKGTIYNNKEKVSDLFINIYDRNVLIETVEVTSSNKFITRLPINSFLTIEITAPGFHTKRFIFDTTLPEDVKKIPNFKFDMDIFSEEEMAGVNTSLLDFPIGMVDYHPSKKKFLRNVNYTRKMKKRYLDLLEEAQMTNRATGDTEE